MGQIDVAKVITAAAASTLGVLSLIILAVAFVGFHFFKRSGDSVKLGVWAAMLLAAVGFGLAVMRQGGEQARATELPRAQPTGTPAERMGAPPPPTPAATVAAVEATPIDTSGRWQDNRGFLYDVTARGGSFVFEQSLGGMHTASGRGTIVGHRVDYAFVVDRTMAQGTCEGTLSADARRVDGSCSLAGDRWDFISMR